jgi:hypothetical protein
MTDENNTYQPLRLKDLAIGERPQERLEKLGSSALSDTELLAMLLRSGSKGRNVLAVAQQLMTEAGTLAALIRWTDRDFSRLKGIGHIKSLQLVTVMEIARRVLTQSTGLGTPSLSVSNCVVIGGKILGALPQSQEPPDQAGRGHVGHRDQQPGPSPRSFPRGDPTGRDGNHLRPQPP